MRVVLLALLLLWPIVADARHLQYLPPSTRPPAIYPAPVPANLTDSDWQIIAEGATATLTYWVHPYNDESGYLRIMFPPWPASLNMLHTTSPYSVAGYSFLHAYITVVTTEGAPVLVPDDPCPGPAQTRLFLYSLANRGTEWERLYATYDGVPLIPSSATWPPVPMVSADLMDLTAWVSALGTRADANPDAFEAAKAGAQLGLVFGGSCFAGHGVGVEGGGADFILQWLWAE